MISRAGKSIPPQIHAGRDGLPLRGDGLTSKLAKFGFGLGYSRPRVRRSLVFLSRCTGEDGTLSFETIEVKNHESAIECQADLRELQDRPPSGQGVCDLHQSPPQAAARLRRLGDGAFPLPDGLNGT
jgi:hypothetical protein